MSPENRQRRAAPARATAGRARRATYVYAVVGGASAPPLEQAPPGVPEAAPARALAVGEGMWVVVADVPLAHYDSETIQRGLTDLSWVSDHAVGHETLIEHLARHGTVVPMKLFTLFASAARARAHVAQQAGELSGVLARIGGCEEWGVRVLRSGQAEAPPPAAGSSCSVAKSSETERAT
jgi:hypothetical protein